MLKYVDVYRCSDGGVLVGHHHNRPGPDNSALAPACNLSRLSPVQGMTNCAWRNAHIQTPACRASSLPGLFNPWTRILGTRNLWVISWPQQNHPEILAISTILTVGRWHWR